MKRISLVLAVMAFAAALAGPAAAGAAEYTVYSCKLPDGRPAPTDGWHTTGTASYAWFDNGCAAGGALAAGLRGISQPVNRSNVGWGFESGGPSVRGYTIRRSARIAGGGANASMYAFSADSENSAETGRLTDYCAFFTGCRGFSGTLVRSTPQIPEGSKGWFLTLGCGGVAGDACNPIGAADFGAVGIESASIRLADDEQPQPSDASGSLTAEAATSGDLEFVAGDEGSGVARAEIEVDGAEVVAAAAGDARCRTVGLAAHDYLYVRPCPGRWRFELSLNPGVIAAGSHTLRARVFDAAGNSATVFGPRRLTVQPVRGSGTAANRIVIDGPTHLKSAYGRKVRLAGRLESSTGEPASGEQIVVALRSAAARRGELIEHTLTGTGGRFAVSVVATANRAIEFSNPTTGATAAAELTVSAAVRLRAVRRRVGPLGRMVLTGRIPGERARRGGSVAIKVRSGGRWRTVGVVPATARGTFRFSYRFRRTRHGRLIFRAVALRSGDLTISPRPSGPVAVTVG